MKKFTSLFALLLGLSVFNAQAIDALKLACSHNGWNTPQYDFTPNGNNQWTLNWDLSTLTGADLEFKIIAVETNETWIGYGDNTVNAPNGWVGSKDDNTGSNELNFVLYNSKTGYKKYKLTATWNPNDNIKSGWTLTVEGVERSSYTVAGSSAILGSDFDINDTNNEMTLSDDETYYLLTKTASLNAGTYGFKVVRDHDYSRGEYPSGYGNNHTFNIESSGLYEVTFKFTPSTYTTALTIKSVLLIEDGNDFSSSSTYFDKASYSRNCNNEWGTLCLPFKITTSNYTNVTFYTLDRIENNAMYLNQLTGVINGGTPVIFKITDNQLNISEENVNVVTSPTTVNASNNCSVHGTFTTQLVTNKYYILDNKFWYGTGQITINPYRAYIEGPAPTTGNGSAPFRIEVDDTEGLQFVEQEDRTVKAYYDLQGRKLDGARKGLVIENGKIIMVK